MQSIERAKKATSKVPLVMGGVWFSDQPQLPTVVTKLSGTPCISYYLAVFFLLKCWGAPNTPKGTQSPAVTRFRAVNATFEVFPFQTYPQRFTRKIHPKLLEVRLLVFFLWFLLGIFPTLGRFLVGLPPFLPLPGWGCASKGPWYQRNDQMPKRLPNKR